MCILVVALGCHPALPFLCAHNRDEARGRPSADDSLEATTRIACGRDRKAGGMVLGLNAETGSFAALTNCRSEVELRGQRQTSRGLLVEHLVAQGPQQADEYLAARRWDGFHVVFGNASGAAPRMRYLWNAPVDASCLPEAEAEKVEAGVLCREEVQWRTGGCELGRGVFVISNENPASGVDWPKCAWLREKVSAFLQSLPPDPPAQNVFAGMESIMSASDVPELRRPSRLPKRFREPKEERLHSGPFAAYHEVLEDFGTVSQRIIVSDARSRQMTYSHRSTNRGWSGVGAGPPETGPWEHIRIPWPAQADSPMSRH